MSSPIAINRPSSPASSSAGSSYTYTSSYSSTSSATDALIYSREELLNLAMSPLAQSYTPLATLSAFPQLLRRTQRTPEEALRTLEHSQSRSPLNASVPTWRINAYMLPPHHTHRSTKYGASSRTESSRTSSPVQSLPTKSPMETRKRHSREAESKSWRRAGPQETNSYL